MQLALTFTVGQILYNPKEETNYCSHEQWLLRIVLASMLPVT
jgi:hypothetical protein